MRLPLLAALQHRSAEFPRSLVPEAALRRVLDTASALSLHGSGVALECRLGGGDRVDLLLAIPAEPASRTALLRDAERLSSLDPAWGRVAALAAEWASPGSALSAILQVLWIELDLPPGRADTPAPLPFLCVDPSVLRIPARRGEDGEIGGERRKEGLARALSLLGEPRIAPHLDALTNCIRSLPPGGRLLHVAPLSARGSGALRMVVSLEYEEIPAFFRSLGADHDLAGLLAAAALVVPCSSTVTLHLDASPRIAPEVAVEVYFPPGSAQLPRLLDALVARGAALPDEARALQTWPFEGRVSLPGESWPVRLLRAVQIKLCVSASGAVGAKAYLGFDHAWALF